MWGDMIPSFMRMAKFMNHMSHSIDSQSSNPHHGKGGHYRIKIQPKPYETKNQRYARIRREVREQHHAAF